MITDDQLKQIMPNLPQAKRQQYLPFLNAAMHACQIDNLQRTAAFVAQLAHESAEFRFMEELWGPIAAQLHYEPSTELSKRLGNTQSGDGRRFKGRGPIQITGRFNYKKYGDLVGVDLCAEPEKAALPEVAFTTAGLFWASNGLNALADADDFIAITKRINGGTNGLADREKYHATAMAVLANGFVAGPPPANRGGARPLVVPTTPLTRGFELLNDVQPEGDGGAVAARRARKRKPVKAA